MGRGYAHDQTCIVHVVQQGHPVWETHHVLRTLDGSLSDAAHLIQRYVQLDSPLTHVSTMP